MSPTATPAVAPRAALLDYLSAAEALFDADVGLLRTRWKGPGYHTRVPAGAIVHEVRSSLDYALALAELGDSVSLARVDLILCRILPLQDLDPTSATYGVWPWLLEEPLERMAPPDWNWADFCGVRLAHLLGLFRGRLSPARLEAAERALGAAAYSIFRRNVGPGYTNIAFKGAVVAGVAGELLDDPVLLHYAERRLERFLAHIAEQGGFTEYSSPPYGLLMLTEAERGLLVARSPRLRALIDRVHRLCWEDFAGALHLPTGQLCGPLSRTYDDLLSEPVSAQWEERLGIPLFRPRSLPAPGEQAPSYPMPPRPCPSDIREKLAAAARPGRFTRQRYVWSATEPKRERTGSRWLGADACLGSANYENFWTQRRPILGCWRVGDDVAVLRVTMRHDGDRDFCSGAVRAAQAGRDIAAICSLVTGRGDFHDVLDKPADGVFRLAGLEVAVILRGPGAPIREAADGVFVLACGDWAAVVRPAHAEFSGHRVAWRAEASVDHVVLRALVDDGAPLVLEPAAVEAFAVAFSLSLQPAQSLRPPLGRVEVKDGRCGLSVDSEHGPLSVSAPLRPEDL